MTEETNTMPNHESSPRRPEPEVSKNNLSLLNIKRRILSVLAPFGFLTATGNAIAQGEQPTNGDTVTSVTDTKAQQRSTAEQQTQQMGAAITGAVRTFEDRFGELAVRFEDWKTPDEQQQSPETPEPLFTTVTAENGANIRSIPSTNSRPLGSLENNTRIQLVTDLADITTQYETTINADGTMSVLIDGQEYRVTRASNGAFGLPGWYFFMVPEGEVANWPTDKPALISHLGIEGQSNSPEYIASQTPQPLTVVPSIEAAPQPNVTTTAPNENTSESQEPAPTEVPVQPAEATMVPPNPPSDGIPQPPTPEDQATSPAPAESNESPSFEPTPAMVSTLPPDAIRDSITQVDQVPTASTPFDRPEDPRYRWDGSSWVDTHEGRDQLISAESMRSVANYAREHEINIVGWNSEFMALEGEQAGNKIYYFPDLGTEQNGEDDLEDGWTVLGTDFSSSDYIPGSSGLRLSLFTSGKFRYQGNNAHFTLSEAYLNPSGEDLLVQRLLAEYGNQNNLTGAHLNIIVVGDNITNLGGNADDITSQLQTLGYSINHTTFYSSDADRVGSTIFLRTSVTDREEPMLTAHTVFRAALAPFEFNGRSGFIPGRDLDSHRDQTDTIALDLAEQVNTRTPVFSLSTE